MSRLPATWELERFAGWLVAELEEHEVEVPDEVAP